jgi:hypothetical protein
MVVRRNRLVNWIDGKSSDCQRLEICKLLSIWSCCRFITIANMMTTIPVCLFVFFFEKICNCFDMLLG